MPSSGVQTCALDRKSTRLNSSHTIISYAVFCLKKNNQARDVVVDALELVLFDQPSGPHQRGSGIERQRRERLDVVFFFNDTATTEIYTLSLHDALPIWTGGDRQQSSDLVRIDYWKGTGPDRKSTRLNSSHTITSYAVFFLKKNKLAGIPPSEKRDERRLGKVQKYIQCT